MEGVVLKKNLIYYNFKGKFSILKKKFSNFEENFQFKRKIFNLKEKFSILKEIFNLKENFQFFEGNFQI